MLFVSRTEIRSIFLSILKLCSVLEQTSPLRVQQIHISSICGPRYNGRRIDHHVSNNLTCTDSSQVWYHLSCGECFFCRENHHPQNSQKKSLKNRLKIILKKTGAKKSRFQRREKIQSLLSLLSLCLLWLRLCLWLLLFLSSWWSWLAVEATLATPESPILSFGLNENTEAKQGI